MRKIRYLRLENVSTCQDLGLLCDGHIFTEDNFDVTSWVLLLTQNVNLLPSDCRLGVLGVVTNDGWRREMARRLLSDT